MPSEFNEAWEALVAHFGAERVNGIISSRRQFGAHLLPDIQISATAQVEQHAPSLLGVHQVHDHFALTMSGLLVRGGDSKVAVTPLQYQDMDVGEAEPFSALNNGLWLFHVGERPIAVLLSQYDDYAARSRSRKSRSRACPTRRP